jgi:hypothetical protein
LEYRYISKLPLKNERIWSYVKETTSHLQNKLTKNIHLGVATRFNLFLFFIRGLDLRPDYQKVGILQSILDSPVLALSATITSSIRKYIDRVLGLHPTETSVVAVVPNM